MLDLLLRFSTNATSDVVAILEQCEWEYSCPKRRRANVNIQWYNVLVSDAEEFDDQIEEALMFLEEYRDALSEVLKRVVEGPILNAGVACEKITTVKSFVFPPSLVESAAQFGMSLVISVYKPMPGLSDD